MNREILFRGQTRKLGEKVNMNGEKQPGIWVYGGIFHGKGDFSIIYGGETGNEIEKHVVYTDTVGQYTEHNDKNKRKIFDGDIVRINDEHIGIVGWFKHDASWVVWQNEATLCMYGDLGRWNEGQYIEVIGNIHDNPEMIGGAM